jgi:hypothetical protein
MIRSGVRPQLYVIKDDLDLRKKGSYMLKVDPALETSADFKFTMYHVDGTESLRTTIQWYKDVWQVIKGLGLDGNPVHYAKSRAALVVC